MHNRWNVFWTVLMVSAALTVGRATAADAGTRSEKAGSGASTSSEVKPASRSQKVDLNTATKEQLEQLPGIGPATAAAIIKARPFQNVNELTNVSGIGPAKFATLKPEVTVKSRSKANVGKPGGAESAAGSSETRTHPGTVGGTASSTSRSGSDVGKAGGVESPSGTAHSGSKPPLAPGQKVDLNSATKEELEALPGIGPVKAQAIIDARPFNTIEDVKKVRGIKEGVFSEIQDHVTVGNVRGGARNR